MNTSYSITSKYQVTLPKSIRENLNITDQHRVVFEQRGDEVIIKKVPTLDEIAAEMSEKFRKSGRKPVTIEQMKEARDTYYQKGGKW